MKKILLLCVFTTFSFGAIISFLFTIVPSLNAWKNLVSTQSSSIKSVLKGIEEGPISSILESMDEKNKKIMVIHDLNKSDVLHQKEITFWLRKINTLSSVNIESINTSTSASYQVIKPLKEKQ